MLRPITIFLHLALLFLGSVTCVALDTAKIVEVTGLKGTLTDGVFKVTQPRTDVKVSVDSWPMPPFMGLTSWAAFTEGMKAPAMVMGDLVLFQDEVNPVMSAALRGRAQRHRVAQSLLLRRSEGLLHAHRR